MIVLEKVIYIDKIRTVSILSVNSNNINLYNMILAPNYNSNPISLGQLYKSEIISYKDLIAITLIKNKEVIALVKKEYNIFTFDPI